MEERCIVGFDVGTSSLKVAVASERTGKFIDFQTFYYDMEEIFPGVAPCSMYAIAIQKVLDSISQNYDIVAIALATHMYSICREINGRMYVYQWNSLWNREPGMEKGFQKDLHRSGCPNDTIYGAYKAATASEEVKGSFVPYGIKEYLTEYLTGQRATDMTTASASGLYDIFSRAWNTDFVQRIGLDCGLLPQVAVHNVSIGFTKKGLLPRETAAVIPGLGDGMSASYACESVSKLCGNLGTSMAVRMITEQGINPEESRLWTYAMDSKRYLTGGISSNGCSVLNWGREEMGFDCREEIDTRQVMFLPWLYGERAPYWSSDLKGTFLGISKDTDKRVMGGAILKSVAFTLSTIVKALETQKGRDDVLILGGGGTNSNALLSIVSGCVDVDIAIMDNTDYLASIGAVISAGEGIGCKVHNELSLERIIKPTGRYGEEFEKWRLASRKIAEFYEQSC